NIHNSIVPGGWIIVAAGRLEGNDLGVSVTRWQTVLAGGTAITGTEARSMLASNGFTNITTIPTPAGAPTLHCGQRPPNTNPTPQQTGRRPLRDDDGKGGAKGSRRGEHNEPPRRISPAVSVVDRG
ncbi:MAG: hypothetical protein ABIQ39_14350, partial [Ilumatobacteraceae bacterium]